ncbi:MAG: hypothetical protein QOJ25_157, partial [Solirubrobacteraceae bacterium]|nr:hypothetical protein [Solirubrobacteraceae bacterium]
MTALFERDRTKQRAPGLGRRMGVHAD